MPILKIMDSKCLNIIGLNLNIAWNNPKANFEFIENTFSELQADIFLFPEMFPTGFCMEADEIADRNEEKLTWMKSFSKKKNAALAGSVSVEENGKFYNRFYFVKPDDTFDFYDKRHLFSYSGEDKIYTSGKERKIVEYKDVKILLQVCYDLRFPVFARNRNDYDAILYVANWPEKRVDAWEHLLKARAIENQAYVFGLNRIGEDGYGLNYKESSHCFFADGTEVSQKNENIISAEIDMEKLKNFREKFKFLDDADDFTINI